MSTLTVQDCLDAYYTTGLAYTPFTFYARDPHDNIRNLDIMRYPCGCGVGALVLVKVDPDTYDEQRNQHSSMTDWFAHLYGVSRLFAKGFNYGFTAGEPSNNCGEDFASGSELGAAARRAVVADLTIPKAE